MLVLPTPTACSARPLACLPASSPKPHIRCGSPTPPVYCCSPSPAGFSAGVFCWACGPAALTHAALACQLTSLGVGCGRGGGWAWRSCAQESIGGWRSGGGCLAVRGCRAFSHIISIAGLQAWPCRGHTTWLGGEACRMTARDGGGGGGKPAWPQRPCLHSTLFGFWIDLLPC